ncbi:DUF3106 domain-containing protein [Allofranklinella schreckenbergeri]|uniref:DUF3106 domain-containing protein n=1 Tax=Allofranklinella schreckenbergeri TaxID=1076744 RepID=UPI001EEDEA3B|nr:DUF3106 domain-containing protein [Allofranklinella schreckenbergeri]
MSSPASNTSRLPSTEGVTSASLAGCLAACSILAALLGHWWLQQRPLLTPSLPPGIAYAGPLVLFGEPQPAPDLTRPEPWRPPTGVHITRPTWDDLSKEHQHLLAGLETTWPYISSAEKRRWLALARQARDLNASDRQRLIQNITAWGQLDEGQRLQVRQEYRERGPDEWLRLGQAWRDYSALPTTERLALAQAAQAAPVADAPPAKRAMPRKNLVRIAAAKQAKPGLANLPKVPLQPVRFTQPSAAQDAAASARATSAITTVRVPDAPAPATPPPARVRYWYGVPITPPDPAPIYAN